MYYQSSCEFKPIEFFYWLLFLDFCLLKIQTCHVFTFFRATRNCNRYLSFKGYLGQNEQGTQINEIWTIFRNLGMKWSTKFKYYYFIIAKSIMAQYTSLCKPIIFMISRNKVQYIKMNDAESPIEIFEKLIAYRCSLYRKRIYSIVCLLYSVFISL